MSKRQTLTLMELTVMLLIFALAAALCMGAFAWASNTARENHCRDRALVQLQNAAEVLKYCAGDFSQAAALQGGVWDGDRWVLDFGEFQIIVKPENTGIPNLGGARLEAVYRGNTLTVLPVRWQEVAYEK